MNSHECQCPKEDCKQKAYCPDPVICGQPESVLHLCWYCVSEHQQVSCYDPIVPSLTSPHASLCLRLKSGRTVFVPVVIVDENRVGVSRGAHPLDRLKVQIPGMDWAQWVERQDLYSLDHELIEWYDGEE